MSDLSNRVAIITGAARGIGWTIARTLARRGMRVGANDINLPALSSVVAQAQAEGLDVTALPGDVGSKADVEAMVEKVEAELGPLWLLVNNAGVYNATPTVALSEAEWDWIFRVDAKGVFLASQAAIQRMIPRREGRIVNVASIGGLIVRTGQIAYCSAKAAVVHFTRCLAVEMAPYGITVNCICPGMTRTQMLDEVAGARGLDIEGMVAMIPAGRMAEEVDHGHLVAYLATVEAAHVTGQVVAVDGGQSLYHPLTAVHQPLD